MYELIYYGVLTIIIAVPTLIVGGIVSLIAKR